MYESSLERLLQDPGHRHIFGALSLGTVPAPGQLNGFLFAADGYTFLPEHELQGT
jgi:hypothetical protein